MKFIFVCFAFVLFLFGCTSKKNSNSCLTNPNDSSNIVQWQEWEVKNWKTSCARTTNPYNREYIESTNR